LMTWLKTLEVREERIEDRGSASAASRLPSAPLGNRRSMTSSATKQNAEPRRGEMLVAMGEAHGIRMPHTTASPDRENRIKNIICEAASGRLGVSN
jgi:hypothetical protein